MRWTGTLQPVRKNISLEGLLSSQALGVMNSKHDQTMSQPSPSQSHHQKTDGPNHHLWNNHGTWRFHGTFHLPEWPILRGRIELRQRPDRTQAGHGLLWHTHPTRRWHIQRQRPRTHQPRGSLRRTPGLHRGCDKLHVGGARPPHLRTGSYGTPGCHLVICRRESTAVRCRIRFPVVA